MERLKETLAAGGHSLVVGKGDEVRTFDGRGVSDLFRLLNGSQGFLKGARVADKVVGKGAAALMIAGGVSEVYAAVISEPALAFFRKYGVDVSFSSCVEHIINRKGDGVCPVETLCGDCATAGECIPLIEKFILASARK